MNPPTPTLTPANPTPLSASDVSFWIPTPRFTKRVNPLLSAEVCAAALPAAAATMIAESATASAKRDAEIDKILLLCDGPSRTPEGVLPTSSYRRIVGKLSMRAAVILQIAVIS
jgi:hypothetical protein